MKNVTKQAKLYKRILAYVIDIVVINIIIVSSFKPVIGKIISTKDFYDIYNFLLNNPSQLISLIKITLTIAVLSLFYWSILEFKLKQTIGKMLFQIYVTSENKKLTFPQCLLRNLTKISFFILWIDSITLLTNKKQRIFEIISNTFVQE